MTKVTVPAGCFSPTLVISAIHYAEKTVCGVLSVVAAAAYRLCYADLSL
ncbi:hypothetical protein ACTZGB_12155 [Yersinia bercovieri]|uniref:Uncharacterized protein n=1 Tax=Yersinia bercovieri ATCC 43970 TaxID=349968 RepID=A0ABM9XUK5_YERBE|nr:hypothetical protein [Yersinia bercovieri]EEQ05074.1 hypothetical protein yberc0001_25400 [Yersinia bercovieri ATCC 43970]MDN0102927.1 hypothetical protein [Yersinia bercovieri]QKJ07557.1 hypothetical protein HRK25_12045 [Yersinia bercovieri ATCC 43970]